MNSIKAEQKPPDDLTSLDELRKRVDAFFKATGRGDDEAYRKKMHAALDDIMDRINARRRLRAEKGESR